MTDATGKTEENKPAAFNIVGQFAKDTFCQRSR